MLPSIELDLAIGYITGAPAAPAPRGSHNYVGIVQTRDGLSQNMNIGPSSVDGWDLPLHVNPLKVGKAVFGARVNGIIQWQYQEMAKFASCGAGPGAAAMFSPLMNLNDDQLRVLGKMIRDAEARAGGPL